MKKSKPDAAAIEVECDACGGTGHPPVKEISLDGGFMPHPARPAAAKAGLANHSGSELRLLVGFV
jgi:hypothetical protein